MIDLGDNKYIIGFDNGYQFGKTANLMFDNSVFPLGKVEPSVNEHLLKFERKYYKVAEGRAAITEDKVSDENARLLTMLAIAKELSAVGVRKAEIILAVGLPFSDYGREKKELIKYYEEKQVMKYEYEGIRYDITISRIFVFPQCYSAIASRTGNMKGDYMIVDIGSKTTDILANAKGYEFLAMQMMKRQGGGMMADKKVISIRFHNSSDEDMELYEKLENEALNGGSLASVVKARIKSSYENTTDSDLKEQIVEVIQDEMHKSSMKIVGALLAGVNGGVSTENIVESHGERDSQLPE